MKLKGVPVKHKVFGVGEIEKIEGDHISIIFEKGCKKFGYNESFKNYITVLDADADKYINNDINKQKQENGPYENIIESSSKEKVISTNENISGKNYFFVFQNKTFTSEKRGGYLWAPKANIDGRTASHWRIMENVKKGDIIFHSVNKKIEAISIATSDCYSATQPIELQSEQMWENDGYMVNCKYIEIFKPIITSDYKDNILELQPSKYAPFNKIGRGNTGYLFQSNYSLSFFLYEKLIQQNKYLKDYNYDFCFITEEEI